MHHFGRGLVGTPSDFGFLGERPTHPELLDWLASEFMRNGWRLKPLHRLIVTSAVYRQSSNRRPEVDALDPDNRLLGRMPVQRLEAETIRDSILAASGCMTDTLYGPPVPVMPDEVGQIVVGVDTRDSAGRPSGKVVPLGSAEFRRSIYVEARRSMPLAMLQAFDEPVMTPNCERRASSTVSPQALFMMNSSFVEEQAVAMAGANPERDALRGQIGVCRGLAAGFWRSSQRPRSARGNRISRSAVPSSRIRAIREERSGKGTRTEAVRIGAIVPGTPDFQWVLICRLKAAPPDISIADTFWRSKRSGWEDWRWPGF